MVTVDEFNETYDRLKSNKEDCIVYDSRRQSNSLSTIDEINNLTYRPINKIFVKPKPRPREIAYPGDFGQRVAEEIVIEKIRPVVEHLMSDRSFGGICGRGARKAIEQIISDIVEETDNYDEPCWIIKVDIHNCFPSSNRRILSDYLVRSIDEHYNSEGKDWIMWFVDRTLTSPQDIGLERNEDIPPEKSIIGKGDCGSPVGRSLFQLAVNFSLTPLDIWLESLGIKFVRYMDDYLFVTYNKNDVLNILPEMRVRLREIGYELNERKFYCQQNGKGFEFIGFRIKMDRKYVDNRIVSRMMERIDYFNHHISKHNLHQFIREINPYFDILSYVCGFNIMKRAARAISKKWWKMLYFDNERQCLVAKDGFKEQDLIIERYELNRSRYIRKKDQIKEIGKEFDDEDDMLKWYWTEDDDQLRFLYDPDKGLRDRRRRFRKSSSV